MTLSMRSFARRSARSALDMKDQLSLNSSSKRPGLVRRTCRCLREVLLVQLRWVMISPTAAVARGAVDPRHSFLSFCGSGRSWAPSSSNRGLIFDCIPCLHLCMTGKESITGLDSAIIGKSHLPRNAGCLDWDDVALRVKMPNQKLCSRKSNGIGEGEGGSEKECELSCSK
jgi:hypothetical protein